MRHRKATPGGGGVNLGIIITPMLDMTFQILAFFIMTYHPSALEGHIDGSLLPPSKKAEGGKKDATPKGDPLPSVDEVPEYNEALMVLIKAVPRGQIENGRQDGEPRWVELRRPESTAPTTVSGDASARDLEAYLKSLEKELDRELKKILKDPSQQKTNLKLEADPDLKHQYWMRIYDTCKIAGFQNIHFISPAVERKK